MAAPIATTFVGVDLAVGLAAEEALDRLDDDRAARLAPTSSTSSIWSGAARLGEGVAAGLLGLLHQVAHERLELLPRHACATRGGAARCVGGDERQVDRRLLAEETSHLARSAASLRRCSAMRRCAGRRRSREELLDQPVHDALVEVLAAEEVSPAVDLTSNTPFVELEDGDVEGAAAEVVDGDVLDARPPARHRRRARRGRGLVG
jgi:hypothetical protein